MAGPLKRLCLSVGNMESKIYLHQKLVGKMPSVFNIFFSDSKESYSEEHAQDGTWSEEGILDT
jgi:hypothetical protein